MLDLFFELLDSSVLVLDVDREHVTIGKSDLDLELVALIYWHIFAYWWLVNIIVAAMLDSKVTLIRQVLTLQEMLDALVFLVALLG